MSKYAERIRALAPTLVFIHGRLPASDAVASNKLSEVMNELELIARQMMREGEKHS